MLKKLKLSLTSLAIFGLFAVPLAVPATVLAQEPDIDGSLCEGANLQFGSTDGCDTEGSQDSLNSLIAQIINIFSVIVAVVAVIMIIVGGFKYITSGGDSGNITGAKNTILYAIIGLVIVALAQFVVRFILGKATELTP